MTKPLLLRAAIGKTPEVMPIRKGLAHSDRIALDLVEFEPLPPAFRLMVRGLEFDLTEMPLVTLAQAMERGVPITGIPVPVSRRFHHGELLCLDESPIRGPKDMIGKTIAVRSLPQTTGVWIRGLLASEYGVDPEQTRWVVLEGAHVEGFQEPGWVSFAEPGKSMIEMLKSGEADAIAAHKGNRDGLRSVVPDADEVAADWFTRTGIFPVNHVLVVRSALLPQAPWLVSEIRALFDRALEVGRQDGTLAASVRHVAGEQPVHSYDPDKTRGAMQMLLDFAYEQGLFQRTWTVDALFGEYAR
jgi:4,5-dihydroxyphthalate decarboxylase